MSFEKFERSSISPEEVELKKLIEKYIQEKLEILPEERITNSMDPECKVVVVIPVFKEAGYIQECLKAFCNQKDNEGRLLNPKIFEVLLVINQEESDTEEVKAENEETFQIVEKFKREHPDLRIYPIKKEFGSGEGGVGAARKRGMDEALLRFVEKEKYEGIIAGTDADTKVDEMWINNIIECFKNKRIDAIGGKLDWQREQVGKIISEEEKNILDLLYQYEVLKSQALGKKEFRKQLVGFNFAVRIDGYVKAGGMNKKKVGEDGAFEDALLKSGCKIEYPETVKVYTAPRVSKRTGGTTGFGTLMEKIKNSVRENKPFLVRNPENPLEEIPLQEAIKKLKLAIKEGKKISELIEIENPKRELERQRIGRVVEEIYESVQKMKKKYRKRRITEQEGREQILQEISSNPLLVEYLGDFILEICEITFKSKTIEDYLRVLREKYSNVVNDKLERKFP